MSDYPMLISNKLHSFRNFMTQRYIFYFKIVFITITFLYLIKRSLYIK